MDNLYAIQHLLVAHGEVGEEIAEIMNQFLLSDDGANLLLIQLGEAQEIFEFRQRERLTENDQEALRIVNASEIPVSADDVSKRATRRSLKHRSHASATLNKLARMGEIIKPPKNGQVVLYAPKP